MVQEYLCCPSICLCNWKWNVFLDKEDWPFESPPWLDLLFWCISGILWPYLLDNHFNLQPFYCRFLCKGQSKVAVPVCNAYFEALRLSNLRRYVGILHYLQRGSLHYKRNGQPSHSRLLGRLRLYRVSGARTHELFARKSTATLWARKLLRSLRHSGQCVSKYWTAEKENIKPKR